jgi:hypothetical protein
MAAMSLKARPFLLPVYVGIDPDAEDVVVAGLVVEAVGAGVAMVDVGGFGARITEVAEAATDVDVGDATEVDCETTTEVDLEVATEVDVGLEAETDEDTL